ERTVQLWDMTWLARLQEDALIRAAARRLLLAGEGRLTDEELRALLPIFGEVVADVASRWRATSLDPAEEARIEAALAQWRRHREMAMAPARTEWATSIAAINAGSADGVADTPDVRGGKPQRPAAGQQNEAQRNAAPDTPPGVWCLDGGKSAAFSSDGSRVVTLKTVSGYGTIRRN